MKNHQRWLWMCLFASVSVLEACGGGGAEGAGGWDGVAGSAPIEQAQQIAARPDSAEAHEPEKKKPACRLTIFGDSIMFGGTGPKTPRLDEPPAATLKRLRPAYGITDLSFPGDSIDKRSFAPNEPLQADSIVVFEEGINDTSLPQTYEAQLLELVERAKGQGAWVVLTGLSRQSLPSERREIYNEIIGKIAADTNSTFADWGSVELREGDLADGIHPTKVYSDRLVERLIGALDGIAPHCSQPLSAG